MSSLNVVISLLFVNTVVDDVLAVPIGFYTSSPLYKYSPVVLFLT